MATLAGRAKTSSASVHADPYIRVPLPHDNAAAIQFDILEFSSTHDGKQSTQDPTFATIILCALMRTPRFVSRETLPKPA
ncbi:hypothetical protein [Pseudarthrobacter sulfonivorans]|uniref:hypothetical protein n=1 Tax=Pseudarthrobacter sulfonivorans TaxID=121292 RepID=UPI0012FE3929|nr:hypothetical protein [Pseudarthrobacter sulfonivorans]